MSDRMKEKPEKRRKPSPVPNTHDRRSRERAQIGQQVPDGRRSRERARGNEEQIFENAPKAPDGISGNWE